MDEFFQEYILGAGHPWGAEGRDEIARRCGDSDKWVSILQRIIYPGKGRRHLVVGPSEYSMIARGRLPAPDSPLMVDGDLAIHGGEMKELPKVVVRGSVEVSDCGFLEHFDITCTGWLSISRCQKVNTVRGEIFGPATIKDCPIGRIGADFRVASDLFVQMCPNMGDVNCEVGGGLEIRGCGGVVTGPAFKVGRHLLIDGCREFTSGGGSVGGVAIATGLVGGGRVFVDKNGVVGRQRGRKGKG